jgi:hypothetical protein
MITQPGMRFTLNGKLVGAPAADEPRSVHDFAVPMIVQVLWLDSYAAHGWENRTERLKGNMAKAGVCQSVGFLVEESDDRIVLAESVSANDNVGCTTAITRSSIVAMTTLRAATE